MKNLALLAKIIRKALLLHKPVKYTCAACGSKVVYKNGLVESRDCGHNEAGINATMTAKCYGSGTVKNKS